MEDTMKKFMCLILSLTLCFCTLVTVSASNEISETNQVSDEIRDAISKELSYYENNQNLIGIRNADFSKLRI